MRHLILLGVFVPGVVLAQAPASARDSSTRRLDPLVVTANRSERPISQATAAVTTLSRAELDALPVRTVAQALEHVPGLVVLQADGLGESPQVIARGFHGGGETDYVLLLLDGVPLNGLTSGGANWDLVPLASIETIEVMRGGGSSLYGDAALGAVVNLITRRAGGVVRTLAASRGAFDATRVDASVTDRVSGRDLSLSFGAHRSGGWRTHELRDALTVRAAMSLVRTDARELTISALAHGRRYEEPGPLDDATLATARRSVLPFYRFDHTSESFARVTVDGTSRLPVGATMHGYVAAEHDRSDGVRTRPLSAEFADTKRRIAPASRLFGSWNVDTRGLGGAGRLMVGTDASVGRLTSTYWALLNGDAAAYAASGTPPEQRNADGHGTRRAIGAFASWELQPAARLHVIAGARYDRLSDEFEAGLPASQPRRTATHSAWSPRVAANVRLAESARQELGGSLSLARSFKAPTMDQLFDQRSTPVPFPPYSITTSNALLVPQTGVGAEGGLRHRAELVPGGLSIRSSVTAYQMDMRDELDFDFATLRYVNVSRSRHRGIETAANLDGPEATSAALTWSLQNAVATNGANAGHFLRAIPRHAMSARVSHDPPRGLSLSLAAVRVQDAPFDDANSTDLPAYTRVDLRGGYSFRTVRLVAEVRNALDATYSSTGFPDPAGSTTRFHYPAAGRVVSIGAEARW